MTPVWYTVALGHHLFKGGSLGFRSFHLRALFFDELRTQPPILQHAAAIHSDLFSVTSPQGAMIDTRSSDDPGTR
jgi:hypothetical protein